ncbi:MAG: hypothetical protein KDA31_12450 [Phycisphaerales bacterium]|nr:hypothetical protein [Phycisphaerales bacterium]MCB9837275.1 hypothetical protein [Phycisphaera sp.]
MTHTEKQSGRRAGGFTLAEIIVSIFIIFLLMGIALVSYRVAANQARIASDRALVNGLKIAVEDFKREFGFIPPLVKDNGNTGQGSPLVEVEGLVIPNAFSPAIAVDINVLRGEQSARIPRYSTYSLAYYLIGALEAEVDGIDGPGFVEVRRAGNFAPVVDPKTIDGGDRGTLELARRGPKKYEPFFDTNRGGVELYTDIVNKYMPTSGNVISRTRLIFRTEIRDRNSVPIRYYRWFADNIDPTTIPGGISEYTDDSIDFTDSVKGLIAYLNIPKVVLYGYGNPLDPLFEVPVELRDATYAIVAAGPNKLFGDDEEYALLRGGAGPESDAMKRKYAEYLGLSITRLNNDDSYRQKAIEAAREDNIIEVGS